MKHVDVYREHGRYAGWPANHGLWSWGDEILVGFSVGFMDTTRRGFHPIDAGKPQEHLLARSLDGGETWTIETPARCGPWIKSNTEHPRSCDEPEWSECPGGVEFTGSGFCLACKMMGLRDDASRFYWSEDRGNSWRGPYRLPLFGQRGVAARTSYLIDGPQSAMLFLTATKPNGREGRPFCAKTSDGGKSWQFISWITEEPPGLSFAIMPSAIRVNPRVLMCAVRHRDRYPLVTRSCIDLRTSFDDGGSWLAAGIIASDIGRQGNPPDLLKLDDDRLCLVYGCREYPFGIRARLSEDFGETWGDAIILRKDGGSRDIGYTRTAQRCDGSLVTVYYFADSLYGDRYIAATLWRP